LDPGIPPRSRELRVPRGEPPAARVRSFRPTPGAEQSCRAFRRIPAKYEFVVHPGARVGDIHLRYEGASSVTVDDAGAPAVRHPLGGLDEQAPRSFQAGRSVDSRFVVEGPGLHFAVGAHGPAADLLIDPWATFCGGSADEQIWDDVRTARGPFHSSTPGSRPSAAARATPSRRAFRPRAPSPSSSARGRWSATVRSPSSAGAQSRRPATRASAWSGDRRRVKGAPESRAARRGLASRDGSALRIAESLRRRHGRPLLPAARVPGLAPHRRHARQGDIRP
jgi:hypothetical protein